MSNRPAHIPPSAARAYDALVEDPTGPIWTHPREDRLTPAMRTEVNRFARQVRSSPPAWPVDGEPPWLAGWLADTWARVPAHRDRGPLPERLVDITPVGRQDLAADPARFVPTGVPLEELIAYTTSGTAGAPTTVPSHPVTTAAYYPLILAAVAPEVTVDPRPDVLDWVTVTSQELGGYIVPSWSSTIGSLTAQVSLRPHGWHDPDHAAAFLARHDPRCITGDPVAFADLLRLAPDLHPRLLVSTAATLAEGLRIQLQEAFGAPVLDLYSTTETGPIAGGLHLPGGPTPPGLRLLQPRLFVEVLDAEGHRLPEGARGEVVVTGGMNPALPLVRHGTGDHATLQRPNGAAAPILAELEGRTPVVFRAADGSQVNSHSVTVALRPLAIPRFTVHQRADGSLLVGVDDIADAGRITALLAPLFGGSPIDVAPITPTPAGKVVPFTVEG